ncbi:MAG: hypothetical protein M0025_04855 [Elusimicrobia bacterium]|nr:hypothetical protein [Elusimicrobiota bacterium]
MQESRDKKLALLLFQAAIAFSGLGALAWQSGERLKNLLLSAPFDGVIAWTLPFYHPYQNSLLNYALLCLVMSVAGLSVYFLLAGTERLEDVVSAQEPRHAWTTVAICVFFAAGRHYMPRELMFLSFFLSPGLAHLSLANIRPFLPVASAVLLLGLCLEPVRVSTGRVLLMNEYPDLNEETMMAGHYVLNRDFLVDISTSSQAAAEFMKKNIYEYSHQNMGRGQLNHIGHVLNPLSEYEAGKPRSAIFMQYGFGNTMLFRWTMELFGGLSLHNYYKCYWYYVLYYMLFAAAAVLIFRDTSYIFFALCGLAGSAFACNYVGFILAPGIIPTIHFADVLVLLLLPGFFARPGYGKAAMLALLAFGAVFLNRQFGAVLALSAGAAAALYFAENFSIRRAAPAVAACLVLPAAAVLFSVLSAGGSAGSDAMAQYLSGFLSFRPPGKVVDMTVVYLALSYLFLFRLKPARSAAKYLYVFVFLYAQGMLFYFYWSGLLNHLPMAAPFLCLQLFLMFRMVEKREVELPEVFRDWLPYARGVAGGIVFLLMLKFLFFFYSGPFGMLEFSRIFGVHRTYNWSFERARVESTTDPAPLRAAVELLRKYSGAENGIVMVSRYDNLVPFLAGKYNRLQFFDLSWYLTTESRLNAVVSRLCAERPEYLFVDTDIDANPSDQLAKLFAGPPHDTERASRFGRLEGLRRVFDSISGDYRLKEAGQLISVYERVRR